MPLKLWEGEFVLPSLASGDHQQSLAGVTLSSSATIFMSPSLRCLSQHPLCLCEGAYVVCVHVHVPVHVFAHICVYVCACMCVHVYVHVCVHVCAHMCACVCVCVLVCVHVCVHVFVCA